MAYWAAVKQHKLGDANVNPDSQTAVMKHVENLQNTLKQVQEQLEHERKKGIDPFISQKIHNSEDKDST